MFSDGGQNKITTANRTMLLAEVDVVALMQSAASLAAGKAKAGRKTGQSCMGHIKLWMWNESGKWRGAVICSNVKYDINWLCKKRKLFLFDKSHFEFGCKLQTGQKLFELAAFSSASQHHSKLGIKLGLNLRPVGNFTDLPRPAPMCVYYASGYTEPLKHIPLVIMPSFFDFINQ